MDLLDQNAHERNNDIDNLIIAAAATSGDEPMVTDITVEECANVRFFPFPFFRSMKVVKDLRVRVRPIGILVFCILNTWPLSRKLCETY